MIVGITFMGFDFVADVDYCVTSYGSPAHMGSLSYPGDPGDPPEWEITSIVLSRDEPMIAGPGILGPSSLIRKAVPAFEATGALFDCLANLDKINDAICEEISASGPPDYSDDDNYF
jgi:hypothetical protein